MMQSQVRASLIKEWTLPIRSGFSLLAIITEFHGAEADDYRVIPLLAL